MSTAETKKAYPYKFLDAYAKEDADFFFGRDDEIKALYEMIFQSDIIVVYGASGTGKTSLIQCGLGNKFQSHDWLPLGIRRSNNINDSLEKSLKEASYLREDSDEFSWFDENFNGGGSTRSEPKLQRLLKATYLNSFKPVYLIFDQFEELFILGNRDEQRLFYASIQEILLAKQPIKLLFSIREEYLGYLFDFEKVIPNLLQKKLRVEAMNIYKVREVITGTTNKKNSLVNLKEGQETEIADSIFNKIRDNEKTRTIQLPYLQVFLDKIYFKKTGDQKRETEILISIDDINQIGDIGDILRDFLEERIIEIKSSLQLQDDKMIWEILSAFVTIEGTKEPLGKNDLYERFPQFASEKIELITDELFRNKILRYSENESTYEIAHDSLAKRIAERRSDDDIAVLEVKRLLKNQLSLKPELRDFFSNKQLQLISAHSAKLTITREEKEWITESEKYLAKQQNKERNRFKIILTIVVTALIIVTFLGIVALKKQNEVNNQLKEIERNDKIAKAKELMSFGDNYTFLGNKEYACDSYKKGLDSLQNYTDENLYTIIKNKLDSLGCK